MRILKRDNGDFLIYVYFYNPLSVEVIDVPEKLELELIKLQYDSFPCSSFNQEGLITFYASLPVSEFCELHKL